MRRLKRKIQNRQYGQAMAEFALTIPIFLLLVFGVIELSRFFLVYSSVYTASREASRFGSSVGDLNNENFLNCEAIAQRAVFSGEFGGVQIDDVIIYYETTPGTIVASCPNVNIGTVPVTGNCHDGSITCDSDTPEYTPELGHRILVDIVTEFDSLLGIVPDLPVRAANGRTIMMEIEVDATPIPRELCSSHVFYSDEDPKTGNSSKEISEGDNPTIYNSNQIYYKQLYNLSDKSNFQVFRVLGIDWDETKVSDVILKYIFWKPQESLNSEFMIWKNPGIDNEEDLILPPINIGNDYWTEFNRIIPAADEQIEKSTIFFVFSKDVNVENFNFNFTLEIQNTSIPADICTPIYKALN